MIAAASPKRWTNTSRGGLATLPGAAQSARAQPDQAQGSVAAAAKPVFQAAAMVEARRRLAEFVERSGKSAPKAVACMEAGLEDAMAVMALPEKYRKRLRTANMQKRLNEEVRRRERVIRIFPRDVSALRPIGALLAEQNEVPGRGARLP